MFLKFFISFFLKFLCELSLRSFRLEWVQDFSISWTNKKENKKLEGWNHVANTLFLPGRKKEYHFLWSFHKRTLSRQSKQGGNLARKDSPLSGRHLKRKACCIVPFLFLSGISEHVCEDTWNHSLPYGLYPYPVTSLLWAFLSLFCSCLALSPPAPAAFRDLSLQRRLPCHTGAPCSSILLGWMAKEPVVEKAQQRRQLLALRKPSSCLLSFQSYLIIYCAHRWLCSSPVSLFSLRLEEPSAFHLGAMIQGLCHLSCFPSGLFYKFLWDSLEWVPMSNTCPWDKNSYPFGFDQIFSLNSKHSLCKTEEDEMSGVPELCTLCSTSTYPSSWELVASCCHSLSLQSASIWQNCSQ